MQTRLSFDQTHRRREPEVMDQPDLAADRHRRALKGLARINFLSGSAGILWPAISELAREVAPRPLRVLDIACGGGDVAIALWRRAHRRGLAVDIDGCDRSRLALQCAAERAAAKCADVWFFPLDVVATPLTTDYDVISCSLFLHHLDEVEAQRLLCKMAGAARRMVLVNDLLRSPFGYRLAYWCTRLFSGCDVVQTDGPLSVAAAFTLEEVRELADRAGLSGATVRRCWPERFLLSWRRT